LLLSELEISSLPPLSGQELSSLPSLSHQPWFSGQGLSSILQPANDLLFLKPGVFLRSMVKLI